MPLFPPSRPVLPRAALRAGASAVLTVLLSGCQYLPSLPTPNWSAERFLGVVTPYRIEIVQGNVITSEQAAAVKVGMARAQVRDLLGSPLVADVFHANRWDYVFTIRRPGAEAQSRHVVVLFADDKLASIDTGGALPTEREFVASIDTFKTKRNAPPLELTPEQLKALPAPTAPPSADAEPIGPVRTYPPLEPAS